MTIDCRDARLIALRRAARTAGVGRMKTVNRRAALEPELPVATRTAVDDAGKLVCKDAIAVGGQTNIP